MGPLVPTAIKEPSKQWPAIREPASEPEESEDCHIRRKGDGYHFRKIL